MSLRLRILQSLIYIIPLIIILFIGVLLVRNLWMQAQPFLPQAVSETLTKFIGMPVEIERLDFDLNKREAFLHKVKVIDPTDSKLMSSAEYIRIGNNSDDRYNVKVYAPNLYIIRRIDGRWNFDALIQRRKAEHPSAVAIEWRVEKGTVHFSDYVPKHAVHAEINNVNVSSMYVGGATRVTAYANCSQTGKTTAVIDVLSGRMVSIKVMPEKLSWKLAEPYLTDSPIENVQSGFYSGIIDCRIEKQNAQWKFYYAGEGTVSLDKVKLKGLKVILESVKSSFYMKENHIVGNAIVRTQSAEINAQGMLEWGLDTPPKDWILKAKGSVKGKRIEKAWQAFGFPPLPHISGAYRVDYIFAGSASKPMIEAVAELEKCNYGEWQAKHLRGKIYLNGLNEIRIREATADCYGSIANAEADINLKTKSLSAFAGIKQADISKSPISSGYPMEGKANIDIHISGAVDNPRVLLSLRSSDLKINNEIIGHAFCRLVADKNEVRIPVAGISGKAGSVRVNGSINLKHKSVNLDIVGDGLRLNSIKKALFNSISSDFDGVGYCSGRIAGDMNAPGVNVNAQVYGLKYDNYTADFLGGTIFYQGNKLTADSIELYSGAAKCFGTGSIDFAGHTPQITARLSADQVSTSQLLKIVEADLPITGILTLPVVQIYGQLQKPSVVGIVEWNSGVSADKVRIKKGSAAFHYSNDIFTVPQSEFELDSGKVELSGMLNLSRHINADADIELSNVPLNVFNSYLSEVQIPTLIVVDGVVNGSAHISGALDELTVASSYITINSMMLNEIPLGSGGGQIDFRNNHLYLNDWNLHKDAEFYQIAGIDYDFDTKAIKGKIACGNINISDYRGLADELGAWFTADNWRKLTSINGKFSASAELNGTIYEPIIDATGSIENLTLSDNSVGKLTFSTGWDAKSINIANMEWMFNDGGLVLQGNWNYDGTISGTADIHAFNLAWMKLWDDRLPEMTGAIDASIDFSGNRANPEIRMSADISQLSYKEYKLDKIAFSLIELSNGRVKTDDGVIKSDQFIARFSGDAPLEFTTPFIPTDKPIQAKLSIDDQALEGLNMIFNKANFKRADGIINASVELNGTLSSPELKGALNIKDAMLALNSCNTEIERLSLTASFINAQAVLKHFTCYSSQGGFITGNGSVSFSDFPKGSFSVNLLLNQFKIKEYKIADIYDKPLSGQVDGTLYLTGSMKKPAVAGKVALTKADIHLPSQVIEPKAKEALAFNPILDVQIAVNENVVVRNQQLRAVVEGDIFISGDFSAPKISSVMNIAKGVAGFPGVAFKLLPDSRIYISYAGSTMNQASSMINLDIFAETNITAPKPGGGYERYKVKMNLRGPLTDEANLNILTSSDPPGLSQERILSLIGREEDLSAISAGGAQAQAAVRRQVQAIFTGYALPKLWGPVESGIMSELDLEEFSLTSDELEPLAIWIGKEIFKNTYIRYHRSISAAQEVWDVKMTYRLPFKRVPLGRIQLGWEYDNYSVNRFMIELDYKF